jgi:hypothetical protein
MQPRSQALASQFKLPKAQFRALSTEQLPLEIQMLEWVYDN